MKGEVLLGLFLHVDLFVEDGTSLRTLSAGEDNVIRYIAQPCAGAPRTVDGAHDDDGDVVHVEIARLDHMFASDGRVDC